MSNLVYSESRTPRDVSQVHLVGDDEKRDYALEVLEFRKDKLFPLLVKYCSGDIPEAENLMQELALQVLRKLPKFRGRGINGESCSMDTWIYAIANNLGKMHCRRKKIREIKASDLEIRSLANFEDSVLDESPSPDEEYLDKDLGRVALEQLEKLPNINREVLTRICLDGMKYEEIARDLKLPLGTVKTRAYRGIRTLRKRMTSNVN